MFRRGNKSRDLLAVRPQRLYKDKSSSVNFGAFRGCPAGALNQSVSGAKKSSTTVSLKNLVKKHFYK